MDLYWRDYPSLISGFSENCLIDPSKTFDSLIMASSQETDKTCCGGKERAGWAAADKGQSYSP